NQSDGKLPWKNTVANNATIAFSSMTSLRLYSPNNCRKGRAVKWLRAKSKAIRSARRVCLENLENCRLQIEREPRETTQRCDAQGGRSIDAIALALSPQGCVSNAQGSGGFFERSTEVEDSADVFLVDRFESHFGIG